MTDEEIWAVWDEVIGVNTGIDPVPFARAIEAARATAEQPEPATVPYSLYVAGCRDFERVAARCDDAAEIIAALQKALAYWMPKVFDDRSAHDAYLLVGYNGEDEPSYWDAKPQQDAAIESRGGSDDIV